MLSYAVPKRILPLKAFFNEYVVSLDQLKSKRNTIITRIRNIYGEKTTYKRIEYLISTYNLQCYIACIYEHNSRKRNCNRILS